MIVVTITEKGGKPQVREFDQPEVTVGRVTGNDIVLPKSNVSKRHVRIVRSAESLVVIDAKSTNGTFVNGKRLAAPHDLRPGDKIFVGDFSIEVRQDEAGPRQGRPTRNLDKPLARTKVLNPPEEAGAKPSAEAADDGPSGWEADDEAEDADQAQQEAVRMVQERLAKSSIIKRPEPSAGEDPMFVSQVKHAADEIAASMHHTGELPAGVQVEQVVDAVLAETVGMGPIAAFLADNTVSEILVNGAHQIFVERLGKLEATNAAFSSNQALVALIERIVAPLGRRIEASFPMVDARLRDGSRVNAVLPPLSLRGPTLTIRKFNREALQIDDLVAGGSLNADMAEFLEVCVQARKNILISGGTGAGKTTLLNVISSFVDAHERIITIEDAAELKLDQDHIVSLEARPADGGGKGGIAIRDLVRNALRMRPDRIIVGECRGGEALDMLQAMNTGHDGSLTTVHANTPRDALSRLETMVLMSGVELPIRAIREQIHSAIHIIVQMSRFADGARRLTHIAEIAGMEGELISMHDLFVFDQKGRGADGRIQGRFRATGLVPKFYEPLRARGMDLNLAIFRNT